MAGASCAALLISGVLASGASAAWAPATPVSVAGIDAQNPEVALDAAGNTTAVWDSGVASSRTIRAAFRPAGGPWEASSELTASIFDCRSPELAVNPSGAAVMVADCGNAAATMRSAYRPAGGPWAGSVQILTSDSGVDPRVALDDAGNAVAVWETGISVQSSYRPAAGSWTADGVVSPGGEVALDPDVAISPTGRALVVWRHQLNRSAGDPVVTVETMRRQGAAAWDTLQDLTLPETSTVPVTSDEPQVAMNRSGDRLAVWANVTDSSPNRFLQSRFGSTGDAGVWDISVPPRITTPAPRTVEVPQLALDDSGGAVAVWRSFDGSSFRIEGSALDSIGDTSWSPPDVLWDTNLNGGIEPSVAASPSGRTTVVWRDTTSSVLAATRLPGGAFADEVPISTTGFGNPRVTMSSTGDAIATWSESSPQRIVVAVDDVTPPVLSPIAAPSSAEPGAPISLSASATDAWSEPVALSWDFGDGASATGGSVSHAYGSAGPFTVTLTATDAAGNTATAQRSITVSGPPGSDRLSMEVVVPKQSWKKIRKARGVKLRCTLDAAGACAAEARVSRKVGRRIGLKAKALSVGAGRAEIAVARGTASVRIKLSRAARSAIGKAEKNVPLKLTVEGTAPGLAAVKSKEKLKIRR